MDKKGFELSLNMIVILIIAGITLILILGFVTGIMPRLFGIVDEWPLLDIEPTASDPITFIPIEVSRGTTTRMSIGFYNNELEDVQDTVIPEISCTGIDDITVTASGLTVPIGESKTYSALVSVPKNTASQQYSCVIKISSTEETFFLTVN